MEKQLKRDELRERNNSKTVPGAICINQLNWSIK
jgi:hypothetical protein